MRVLALYLTLYLIHSISALPSNVCEHFVVHETQENKCVRWSRACDKHQQTLACCQYENVTLDIIKKEEQCCLGWTDYTTGDDSCSNSTCEAPRNCSESQNRADEQFSPAYCNTTVVCYPGECHRGHGCECPPGFRYQSRNRYCSLITVPPNITNVRFDLSYINSGSGDEETKATAYKDEHWMNWHGFSAYTLEWETFFLPDNVPPLPPQINTSTFYVVNSYATVKLTIPGSSNTYSKRSNCEFTNKDRMKCAITNTDIQSLIKHSSRFEVQITSQNGGKLTLNRYSNFYSGQSTTYSMNVQFDFVKPLHHLDGESPLTITPEVAKTAVQVSWPGWVDDLSGIGSYTLYIYKLKPNGGGSLVQPVSPIHTESFANTTYNYTYSPTEPGVYSYVLEIMDLAGNTEYSRRFGIYDPTSTIERNKHGTYLYASSASQRSNYRWQNNTSGINVTWKNYFYNKVQKEGYLLDKITRYPNVNGKLIPVLDKYDDFSGARSFAAISNINGITRYDYFEDRIFLDAKQIPTANWITLSKDNFLTESVHITLSGRNLEDGHGERIWVRAHDIMNHTEVDHIDVYFDKTGPTLKKALTTINTNIQDSNMKYKFATRVETQAIDTDSGISQISWTVLTKEHQTPLASGKVHGNKMPPGEDCDILHGCYKTGEGHCYCSHHVIEINHCDIHINKTDVPSSMLNLRLDAFNGAYLSTSYSLQLGKASSLAGIDSYKPPHNVHKSETYLSGAFLVWDFLPSCYNRTKLRVSYGPSSNPTKTKLTLEANATSLSINGLDLHTKYTVRFVVVYGDEESDPLEFHFKTDLPTLYIVGLVIEGIVILVIVGILLRIRFMINRGSPTEIGGVIKMSDLENGTQSRDSRPLPDPVGEFEPDTKPAYTNNVESLVLQQYEDTRALVAEDNIYDDLTESLNDHIPITRDSIKFVELLHEGSFNTVVSGTIHNKTGDEWMVAVKYPSVYDEESVNHFEEDIQAIAKHARLFGHHKNILKIHGAIVDGQDPAMLVMEICDNGSLRNWLEQTKGSEIEKVHNITVGIASGMDFLASKKKIVHGKLNSYNVLLTEDLVPKIKGFLYDSSGKECVQWIAPEVLSSSKAARHSRADVWSFGVILWELYSAGALPYQDIEEKDLLQRIEDGYRMEAPDDCPEGVEEALSLCWQLDEQERPSFNEIIDLLNRQPLYDNT